MVLLVQLLTALMHFLTIQHAASTNSWGLNGVPITASIIYYLVILSVETLLYDKREQLMHINNGIGIGVLLSKELTHFP